MTAIQGSDRFRIVRSRGCRDRYARLHRRHFIILIIGNGVLVVQAATVRGFTSIMDSHFMVGQNPCKSFSCAFTVILVAKSVTSPIDVGF